MSRRTWRRVLAIVVASSLGALGFLLGRTLQRRDVAAVGVPQLSPDVSQRIESFRRVKVEGDRKVWELSAREARYVEEQGMVEVEAPEVAFFGEQGDSVRMTAKRGRVFLDGGDLVRAELADGIEVRMQEHLLTAQSAKYDREVGAIVAPGPIRLSGGAMTLEGDTMVLSLRSEKLQILHQVKTTFRSDRDDAPRS